MSYSAINVPYAVPAQTNATLGALMGAAAGAIVGAVVLAAVVAVDKAVYSPSSLYSTVTVRPATGVVAGVAPVGTGSVAQTRAFVGSAPSNVQRASYQGSQEVLVQAPQGLAVYNWAFVIFAAVAGAVNGLFLWNNRRVAMASTMGRREALMAGAAAAGLAATPAFAAYGDAANVFGKAKDVEQYFEVSGDGWSAKLPGKYNSSKETEVAGQVARWEDNFDAVNNAYVVIRNVGKNSVADLGDIDAVRNSLLTPLLGTQVYDNVSISEGGFAPGKFGNAAVLDQKTLTQDGKTFYQYEFLTRTADGNEGGRHQLFLVTASNGKLYIFKHQAGDKRWFKGLEKLIRASLASFKVK